ncbi:MAG: aminopeptidase [Terracidiphilus sp.]
MVYGFWGAVQTLDKSIVANPTEITCKSKAGKKNVISGDCDRVEAEGLDARRTPARGANESPIHADWMIGSGELDIDGVTATGATEPPMRKGEVGVTGCGKTHFARRDF